jgi:hypothetical protein
MKEYNMKTYTTTIAAAAVILVSTTAAFADPNIDMSSIQLNHGTFDMNINSQSAAGASIAGTRPNSTVTAEAGAWNMAGGAGGVSFDMSGDTNNAGAGVSGNMDVSGGGVMMTGTTGEAYAETSGRGAVNTFAGTFGSAAVGWDGTFNHTMRTDDWN